MYMLSYSELRANLKDAIDRAVNDHEPIIVKRARGGDAVLLSREDYDSMMETAHLLRSPANAKQLREAMKRPRKQLVKFKSVAALKNAVGL